MRIAVATGDHGRQGNCVYSRVGALIRRHSMATYRNCCFQLKWTIRLLPLIGWTHEGGTGFQISTSDGPQPRHPNAVSAICGSESRHHSCDWRASQPKSGGPLCPSPPSPEATIWAGIPPILRPPARLPSVPVTWWVQNGVDVHAHMFWS